LPRAADRVRHSVVDEPAPTARRSRFDGILVCEARYPLGEASSVQIGQVRIDLPALSLATPRRVVVMGDTGCQPGTKPGSQSCTGGGHDAAWPFARLATSQAQPPPDLIIHVGDYNYRGTPASITFPPRATGYARDLTVKVYDAGDNDEHDETERGVAAYWSQNMAGSPQPDGWAAWRDDFFRPAAGLLAMAPWLFSRGNHELCSYAGPGWFYLLDASSPLLGPGQRQAACPPQLPPAWKSGAWPKAPALPFEGERFPTEPVPPFRLRLGGLDIVAIDSSNASDVEQPNIELYSSQYRSVRQMLADGTPTWIVTHRPIWGVDTNYGAKIGDSRDALIDVTQQEAIRRNFPAGLPSNVAAVFGGHLHRFQAIGFRGGRPPQLVVGNSGVELDEVVPKPSRTDPKRPIPVANFDGAEGSAVGLRDFGLMVVTPGRGTAWTSTLFSPSGAVLATCNSAWPGLGAGRSVCVLE
jgi:hypothetical protein